jgi:hypothetical protein
MSSKGRSHLLREGDEKPRLSFTLHLFSDISRDGKLGRDARLRYLISAEIQRERSHLSDLIYRASRAFEVLRISATHLISASKAETERRCAISSLQRCHRDEKRSRHISSLPLQSPHLISASKAEMRCKGASPLCLCL